MAGLRYLDLIEDAEAITQVTGERALVRRLVNQSLAYICAVQEWLFLWTRAWVQTVAPYETGNVNLTNGDATVSGGASSPTFTSAMVGRKIRFGTETAFSTIKSLTSATEVELDQPYTGTTDTDVSYSIYKDEYLLQANVDKQKYLTQSENGIVLFSLSPSAFDEWYPIPTGEGTPSISVFRGKAEKTYSTGTVSLPASSRTLTGIGTGWTSVEGFGRGTVLKIGTALFTVNTVNSDTQLTLYEANGTTAVAAGTSYTAVLDNYVAQLHSIPDAIMTIYYTFQRMPAILDAENDVPELPIPMHPLVGLRMLPTLWRLRGQQQRVLETQTAFDQELARWVQTYSLPVLNQRHPIYPFSAQREAVGAPWNPNTGIPLRF